MPQARRGQERRPVLGIGHSPVRARRNRSSGRREVVLVDGAVEVVFMIYLFVVVVVLTPRPPLHSPRG